MIGLFLETVRLSLSLSRSFPKRNDLTTPQLLSPRGASKEGKKVGSPLRHWYIRAIVARTDRERDTVFVGF